MPYTRMRTISSSVWFTDGSCRESFRAAANCSVSPIASSNCRIGNSPASLVNSASDGSTTTGLSRKSNDICQTDCIIIASLRALSKVLS